jgi:hypothetical protein
MTTSFYRYVPRKPRLVGGDESARNEISILIAAGMPRALRREHQITSCMDAFL